MFPRLAVLRKFCQLGAIEKHHKFISISKRERERKREGDIVIRFADDDDDDDNGYPPLWSPPRRRPQINISSTSSRRFSSKLDRRKIPRHNVCRITHPRNDRFFFSPFLSLCVCVPTRRIYNFAIFFSCSAHHRLDLFICLFIYFFPHRSSFRGSNSICHADGSFDNILPLDLYVSRCTTTNNGIKNSGAATMALTSPHRFS